MDRSLRPHCPSHQQQLHFTVRLFERASLGIWNGPALCGGPSCCFFLLFRRIIARWFAVTYGQPWHPGFAKTHLLQLPHWKPVTTSPGAGGKCEWGYKNVTHCSMTIGDVVMVKELFGSNVADIATVCVCVCVRQLSLY